MHEEACGYGMEGKQIMYGAYLNFAAGWNRSEEIFEKTKRVKL